MQHQLPVAVVDPFRQTCRAGRVEGRRLSIFVQLGKVVIRRSRGQNTLVLAGESQTSSLRRRPIGKYDECSYLRQLRLQSLEKTDKFIIDEEGRGFRVIDGIGDLLGREADVYRLQHRSHHRDCKECLKKPVAVPIENTDRISGPHAQFLQRGCEPSDAFSQLPISQARSIAINDLLILRLQERRVQ